MRVVLSSAGPRSEVFPMLALAGELVKRGHTVTLCVPEKYRSKLMVLEHRMVTCGVAFEEYLEGPRTGEGGAFVRALATQLPSQFVAMRDSLREADVLVSGGYLMAAASQAETQRIPYFTMVHTPLFLDPGQFPSAGMPLKKGLFDSVRSRRKEWESVLLPVLNHEREASHLSPVTNLYQYLYRTGHVLAAVDSSIASLPVGPGETVTGFWHFDDSGFVSDELVSFLQAGSAPVLIEPLGLPEETALPFLEELCAHLTSAGIRAVVHPGWTGLQQAKLPENCRALNAFPSERFAAILHAGTSQAFAAAAHAGIPQVTVPLLMEHGYWSQRISSLGLGPGGVRADASRVAAALREAASGGNWRDRCRELAERLAAQNGPSVAAETIEKFGAEAGHGG